MQPNNQSLEIITIEQHGSATILKTPSDVVSFPLNEDALKLIEAMKDKLYELGGVGLAAPQVKHNKRIIAIYITEDSAQSRDNAQAYPMHIMINPTYEPTEHAAWVLDFESCYSVADTAGEVPRYDSIKLTYQNEQGQAISSIESGFYARVLQHEIDHIDGVLFTDRFTQDCIRGSIEEIIAMRQRIITAEEM